MANIKSKNYSDEKICNSFEEWQSYYLFDSTEKKETERLRADSSKLAISLANKTVDELLSAKHGKALNK